MTFIRNKRFIIYIMVRNLNIFNIAKKYKVVDFTVLMCLVPASKSKLIIL